MDTPASAITYPAIPSLSDLQLALLVCFTAEQHPIVRAPAHLLDEAQAELEDAARTVFGLTSTVIECGEDMQVEEFVDAVVGGGRGVDGRIGMADEVCAVLFCLVLGVYECDL
jgi:hypothetical protein